MNPLEYDDASQQHDRPYGTDLSSVHKKLESITTEIATIAKEKDDREKQLIEIYNGREHKDLTDDEKQEVWHLENEIRSRTKNIVDLRNRYADSNIPAPITTARLIILKQREIEALKTKIEEELTREEMKLAKDALHKAKSDLELLVSNNPDVQSCISTLRAYSAEIDKENESLLGLIEANIESPSSAIKRHKKNIARIESDIRYQKDIHFYVTDWEAILQFEPHSNLVISYFNSIQRDVSQKLKLQVQLTTILNGNTIDELRDDEAWKTATALDEKLSEVQKSLGRNIRYFISECSSTEPSDKESEELRNIHSIIIVQGQLQRLRSDVVELERRTKSRSGLDSRTYSDFLYDEKRLVKVKEEFASTKVKLIQLVDNIPELKPVGRYRRLVNSVRELDKDIKFIEDKIESEPNDQYANSMRTSQINMKLEQKTQYLATIDSIKIDKDKYFYITEWDLLLGLQP